MIKRIRGDCPAGRNQSSSYRDLVWTVATAWDESLDLAGQTSQSLEALEKNLAELGSDKTKIISANVFIADINDKPVMDAVWNDWIGDNEDSWPQRACLGVDLGSNWLIEITVVALRDGERA